MLNRVEVDRSNDTPVDSQLEPHYNRRDCVDGPAARTSCNDEPAMRACNEVPITLASNIVCGDGCALAHNYMYSDPRGMREDNIRNG